MNLLVIVFDNPLKRLEFIAEKDLDKLVVNIPNNVLRSVRKRKLITL